MWPSQLISYLINPDPLFQQQKLKFVMRKSYFKSVWSPSSNLRDPLHTYSTRETSYGEGRRTSSEKVRYAKFLLWKWLVWMRDWGRETERTEPLRTTKFAHMFFFLFCRNDFTTSCIVFVPSPLSQHTLKLLGREGVQTWNKLTPSSSVLIKEKKYNLIQVGCVINNS